MVYGGCIKTPGSREWWVGEAPARERAGLLFHCAWPALGPGFRELGKRSEVVTVSRGFFMAWATSSPSCSWFRAIARTPRKDGPKMPP